MNTTWLKDKSLAELDNLLVPNVLADEIAKILESALGSFRKLVSLLKGVNQRQRR